MIELVKEIFFSFLNSFNLSHFPFSTFNITTLPLSIVIPIKFKSRKEERESIVSVFLKLYII